MVGHQVGLITDEETPSHCLRRRDKPDEAQIISIFRLTVSPTIAHSKVRFPSSGTTIMRQQRRSPPRPSQLMLQFARTDTSGSKRDFAALSMKVCCHGYASCYHKACINLKADIPAGTSKSQKRLACFHVYMRRSCLAAGLCSITFMTVRSFLSPFDVIDCRSRTSQIK